ncbi:bifunctional metallophosphatase/5'-nucleotidase [Fundicoccus culcitae]|uniref:5'-nucleotidase C-terminal domain-containing protein n=1 Tax=Fundicoccus culcitae TaxID=2969821 RepID=A0ABY5P6D8_9LACT|nr:5'-nucleotidase C-terminal domain-containing protein [Fundicoccus culcitae]UUX34307.1 5'-nucleotidase C-terminal domain-containing protein [Fundicoccus culcitae]
MKIVILHTNDLHGHLEHWPIIQEYFDITSRLHDAKGELVLRVDIGDAIDAVHPLIEATDGQIIIDLFNQANYHLVTIGNNEGLGLSHDQLKKLYRQANYSIVLANLIDRETNELPEWAQAYHVIETQQGPKLYFIGLTANYQSYILNGYQPIDPLEALRWVLDTLPEKQPTDLIIILSHVGYPTDIMIAEQFEEVDLIIGSHTHHLLSYGEQINQTMLAAAGKYGYYVGQIELELDDQYLDGSSMIPSKPWQIDCAVHSIYHLSDITATPIKSDNLVKEGRIKLEEYIIANLPHAFYADDFYGENSYIQMALNAISYKEDTDIAILNTGLFLSDIHQGLVSRNHLHESLPHPMHLVTLTMTGEHMLIMLEQMREKQSSLLEKPINGMGFRGKVFGKLIFKGLDYRENESNWYYYNQPIQLDKNYQIVTVDHLWFVPFFPAIDQYGSPKLHFPDFIRHVVGEYLAEKYPLNKTE